MRQRGAWPWLTEGLHVEEEEKKKTKRAGRVVGTRISTGRRSRAEGGTG